MVTVVQGKVCAKNHPGRLSRLATIHQRYRQTDGRTDGRISYGIGLDLTVGQKPQSNGPLYSSVPIIVLLHNGRLLCGFNVPIKCLNNLQFMALAAVYFL